MTETLVLWDGEYTGDVKEGKRHGEGVMKYYTGAVFRGKWLDDEWSEGTHIESGEVYHGPFKRMNRHGQGRLEWRDGSVYDGEFVDGVMQGWGRYNRSNGEEYITGYTGYFDKGSQSGYGEYHDLRTHLIYYGLWLAGLRSGFGVQISPLDSPSELQAIWLDGLLVKVLNDKEAVVHQLRRFLQNYLFSEEIFRLKKKLLSMNYSELEQCVSIAQDSLPTEGSSLFDRIIDSVFRWVPGFPRFRLENPALPLGNRLQADETHSCSLVLINNEKVPIVFSIKRMSSEDLAMKFTPSSGKLLPVRIPGF